MVEAAQAAGITVVLALIPPSNNWGALHYSGETGNVAIICWNMNVATIALAYGVKVADYYTALTLPNGKENTADFYPDGVHPIGPGYAAMWKVLLKVLP
jgi:lysophospholipase L1-like esterase